MSKKPTYPAPKSVEENWPEKWLKASDLKGNAYEMTIATVVLEWLYSSFEQEHRWVAVLEFTKGKRRLALNKTQEFKVREIAGTGNYADWQGVKITIAPHTHNRKPTIRISEPAPPVAAVIAKNSDASASTTATARIAKNSDAEIGEDDVICIECGEILPAIMTYEDDDGQSVCAKCHRADEEE